MKSKLGLVVATAFTFLLSSAALGCSADEEADAAPPPEEVSRLASQLERRLPSPLAVPSDTPIGQSIDAVIEAKSAELTAREPVVNLGANGKKCLVVRFDDAEGKEVMRRETCERDILKIGKTVFTADTGKGRIEHVAEGASYEVFDDDQDGKVDRVVESGDRLKTPPSLADFGPNVSITGNGAVATRTLVDRDHDGRFEIEAITATTSFLVKEPKPAAVSTP